MKDGNIKWFVLVLVAIIGTVLLAHNLTPPYRPGAQRLHNVNRMESVSITLPTATTNR